MLLEGGFSFTNFVADVFRGVHVRRVVLVACRRWLVTCSGVATFPAWAKRPGSSCCSCCRTWACSPTSSRKVVAMSERHEQQVQRARNGSLAMSSASAPRMRSQN